MLENVSHRKIFSLSVLDSNDGGDMKNKSNYITFLFFDKKKH